MNQETPLFNIIKNSFVFKDRQYFPSLRARNQVSHIYETTDQDNDAI